MSLEQLVKQKRRAIYTSVEILPVANSTTLTPLFTITAKNPTEGNFLKTLSTTERYSRAPQKTEEDLGSRKMRQKMKVRSKQ